MKSTTIFMVDDYLLTRIAQKKYFSKDEGFEIIGDFSNISDCLNALSTKQPDIILMDIELPDINGIEAIKIIKEKYPKVKVIIFTSTECEELIMASLANGACGYVLKNCKKADLKEIIKTVMKGVFWMDLKNANAIFSKLSSLNFSNFENITTRNNLKKRLTNRELEVLKLMTEGKTNSQIAQEIVVSTNTAKAHVGSILNKLSAKDRVQAVVKALRTNLV